MSTRNNQRGGTINRRVMKDIQEGTASLLQHYGIYIAAEESNYNRIHFIMPGPDETPFEGGLYHGMIRLNDNHPISPPNIHLISENGRIEPEGHPIPNSSRGICTTTSSFHPEEWTPVNNLETIIKGLISLMCDSTYTGVRAINKGPAEIRAIAKRSISKIALEPIVQELFPELYIQLVEGTYVPPKLSTLCKEVNKAVEKPIEKQVEKVKPESKPDSDSEPDAEPDAESEIESDVEEVSDSESEESEASEEKPKKSSKKVAKKVAKKATKKVVVTKTKRSKKVESESEESDDGSDSDGDSDDSDADSTSEEKPKKKSSKKPIKKPIKAPHKTAGPTKKPIKGPLKASKALVKK